MPTADRVRRWSVVSAAAALLAGVLTACHAPDPQLTPAVQQIRMVSAAGQDELLLLPPGGATKLVLFMHGFDADQDQLLTDTGLFPVRDALLKAGYAIASSGSHGDNAGNPQSVADQQHLLVDAKAKLATVTQLDVMGFSMGGLDGLLAAAAAPKLVHAVVLLSPVTDQAAFFDGRYAGVIANAFSARSPAQLRESTVGSNPSAKAPSSYEGPKYQFWHSPEDDVVPEQQSLDMVARLREASVDVQFEPLDGGHGDLSKLSPASVVQFVESS